MYVFREYCLQLIVYSVSAQGVVECIINVRDDDDDDDGGGGGGGGGVGDDDDDDDY